MQDVFMGAKDTNRISTLGSNSGVCGVPIRHVLPTQAPLLSLPVRRRAALGWSVWPHQRCFGLVTRIHGTHLDTNDLTAGTVTQDCTSCGSGYVAAAGSMGIEWCNTGTRSQAPLDGIPAKGVYAVASTDKYHSLPAWLALPYKNIVASIHFAMGIDAGYWGDAGNDQALDTAKRTGGSANDGNSRCVQSQRLCSNGVSICRLDDDDYQV